MVFNTLTLNSGCTLDSPGEIVFMEMPGPHPREFAFLTKKKSSTRDSDAQLGLGTDLDDLECGKAYQQRLATWPLTAERTLPEQVTWCRWASGTRQPSKDACATTCCSGALQGVWFLYPNSAVTASGWLFIHSLLTTQSTVLRPAARACPGSLWETQIVGPPPPQPAASECAVEQVTLRE